MKSKISRAIHFFIAFYLISTVSGQTADEIITRHLDAHGGTEAWSRVEAIKVTGQFTAFSLENDYSAYKTSGGSYFGDLFLGEKHVTEAIHENDGWTIDPWQEMDYARPLNAGEMNALMQKAEFITPFLHYKEKGYSVEYPGPDTLDGMAMHILTLTRPNGKTETWYLKADNYLEYKCESDWVDFAMTVPAETYFDDFRDVDGLVFPFFVERTFWQRDRILLVENIEINPEIDPSMFTMPRREEMEKLSFLEGDWDVAVEILTRRGTWYPMGKTTSSIQFVSKNLLQEEIIYERIFRFSKIRNYTYHEAGDNYLVSEYDDVTTSLGIFTGELNDTALIFDNAHVQVGDTIAEGGAHMQYLIRQITADGFIMEQNRSIDTGKTWLPRDRFTYTRRKD